MPYSFKPPGLLSRLKTTTSWPSTARRCAHDSPAGPPPTTATLLAAYRCSFEQLLTGLENRIGRVALQQAYLNRLFFMRISNAGFLTENFGRANSRTHATHDVLAQYRVRRAAQIVAAYFLDEARNINAGRAGRCARRVVTKVTAVCLNQRLGTRQWWMQVGEVLFNFCFAESPGSFDVADY